MVLAGSLVMGIRGGLPMNMDLQARIPTKRLQTFTAKAKKSARLPGPTRQAVTLGLPKGQRWKQKNDLSNGRNERI